jgi:hypothetical protein
MSSIAVKRINPIAYLFIALLSIFFMVGTANAASSWEKQDFKVKGTWSIEQRTDGDYLVLSDDFKTKKAPDLKIFLSNTAYQNVTGKNATNDAVEVTQLSSHKGGQSYKIPANINVSDYSTLILHCEQYSKLWAATPLK